MSLLPEFFQYSASKRPTEDPKSVLRAQPCFRADAQHPWSTKDRSKPSHTAGTSPKPWESTRHRGFRQPTDREFSSSSTRSPFPLPRWTARSCLLSQEFEGREADAFLGIQPLKRDASSPPSPSPAGRRRPPTTHVPKSRVLHSGKASSSTNEQEKLFPKARNRSEGGRSPRPKLPERGKRSRRVATGTPQP